MRDFSKNECMLDTILVAEHCCEGVVLNWSKFLLNELFEACEYVYMRSTNFIFKYFLMTLAMWKWCEITDEKPLALTYTPWRTFGNPNNKEINEMCFKDWYQKIPLKVRVTEKIPNGLLDS